MPEYLGNLGIPSFFRFYFASIDVVFVFYIMDISSRRNLFMNANYFKNFSKAYLKAAPKTELPDSFKSLKVLELWLRACKRVSAVNFTDSALEEVLKQIPLHKQCEFAQILFTVRLRKHTKSRSETAIKKAVDNDEFLARIVDYCEKPFNDDACSVAGIITGGKSKEFYMKVTLKYFADGSMGRLANAELAGDLNYERAKVLQKEFSLTDLELNMLLFHWIMNSSLSIDMAELPGLFGMSRSTIRSEGENILSLFKIMYSLSNKEMSALMADDGTLRRMCLLKSDSRDGDLVASPTVLKFISGEGSSDLSARYYELAPAPSLPFEKLSEGNKDALLLREMIRGHKVGTSQNILLYGVEGTGKTELAKAIVDDIKVPAPMIILPGATKRGVSDDSVLDRFEAIRFADCKFKDQRAVIIVDEADDILNCSEKGFLNRFMETLGHPVLWIMNNYGSLENSTRRRFDFSIEFKSFDAKRRAAVWKSVAAVQGAKDLIPQNKLEEFAQKMLITAGGITQAICCAKHLQECNSGFTPEAIIDRVARAQSRLIGLEMMNTGNMARGAGYDLSVLNVCGSFSLVERSLDGFNSLWNSLKEDDAPRSLNILLYGPPGTGKTEFVRNISRRLERPLIIKRAGDLLDCYVGNTEKRIAAAFEEAEESKSILFLDEADSFFSDRSEASKSWEVTQVNELLMRMENFKGIFLAATNFNTRFDSAASRRFAYKVEFSYMKPDGIEKMWKMSFPGVKMSESVRRQTLLAPGDFNAVYNQVRYLPEGSFTAEELVVALEEQIAAKDAHGGRTLGL